MKPANRLLGKVSETSGEAVKPKAVNVVNQFGENDAEKPESPKAIRAAVGCGVLDENPSERSTLILSMGTQEDLEAKV